MVISENKKRPEVLFKLQNYKKNQTFSIGVASDHTIVFVLQGSIVVTTKESTEIEFIPDSMFFCSKTLSPYEAVAKEDSKIIQLNTQFVMPFMDWVRLNEIIAKYAPEPIELAHLNIEKPLRIFLSNVVYYGRNKISSPLLQNIKVREFIFLLRMHYDYESLARFFSTLALSQNPFKINVLSNYSHDSTVNSLAEKCYMTTKTFTRKFKTEFGTTPYKWMMEQKIKSLEYTLTHQTKSIEEIVDQFFFSTVSELLQFCRKYKINTETIKNRTMR